MTLHNRKDQIVDFLIFRSFLPVFVVKKPDFQIFWPQKGTKKTKKSENQKFDPCDCGDTSEVDLDQFLALENDLVLSFFVFREIPVNRIWNLA